jgi:quercetin dioxygenase-like cupin family protein
MNIKNYKNLKEALEAVVKDDRDYILIRHTLKKGDEIKRHYHEKANEWLILDSGCVQVRIGGEEKEVRPKKGDTISLRFRSISKHSLLAKSNLSYFVLRDKKDNSIYVKN